ncbi:unnamed protein product, partial [Meganyctiphanes norvegica]
MINYNYFIIPRIFTSNITEDLSIGLSFLNLFSAQALKISAILLFNAADDSSSLSSSEIYVFLIIYLSIYNFFSCICVLVFPVRRLIPRALMCWYHRNACGYSAFGCHARQLNTSASTIVEENP